MTKVIFKKGAPSGFQGYGKIEEVGEKALENFQKTGMYDIEIVQESKPKKAKKKSTKKEDK